MEFCAPRRVVRIPTLIGYLLALCLLPAAAAGQGGFFSTGDTAAPTAEPFTVSVTANPAELPAGDTGTLRVRIGIEEGFKIYADDTTVRPEPVPGLVFGTPEFPPAVEKAEPDGNIARFFVSAPVITLSVQVAQGRETGAISVPVTVGYRGCSESNCFFPATQTVSASMTVLPGPSTAADAPKASASDSSAQMADSGNVVPADAPPPSAAGASDNPFQRTARRFGLIGALAAAFLWGFLASLTPCVYPMIPITVGVIGAANAGSVSRGFVLSLVYVLGMSLTYAAFGVAAAWSGNLFGAYAGHPVVRIIVAAVFVLLALSLFDLFYFQMPTGVSARLSTLRKSGGVLGILVTGAVAGAVVGPCVGPMLAGLLIYIAGIGDRIQGFLLMWSFALGMGILFLIIGTFSGAASALPRSGAWMGKLKAVFGLLMLGAALYYIAPLLPERVVWLVLGTLLIGAGVFAGALDRLETDAGRGARLWKTAGILVLVLGVVYAGRFALDAGSHRPAAPAASTAESGGIPWLDDTAAGLALARKTGRPVMIDFTAEWCAVCRQLETETFPHPEVVRMAEAFVPIRVDATDANAPRVRELQRRYGVVGLPTVLFLTPKGTPLPDETLTEFIPPERLLARMRRVRQRIAFLTDPTHGSSDIPQESPS